MKVAIIGATGLVGRTMSELLKESKIKISEFIPAASENSAGGIIEFDKKEYRLITVAKALEMEPDIALYSAGSGVSLDWAEKFAKRGCYVIDNSSAWRMDKSKKLIVPEVNASILTKEDKIIPNPNCSTIQLVVAIAPLHRINRIKKLVVSTYQSITGSGKKAVDQMNNERNGIESEKLYPYEIDKNCLPHCDDFTENSYTKEEMKLFNETRKILDDDKIEINATSVRVPVEGGHSESVTISFENDIDIDEVYKVLECRKEIVVQDDISKNIYPMPKYSHGKDEVFVGRIRKSITDPRDLNLWIVADNLRKGAATNTIQIAEYVYKKFLK